MKKFIRTLALIITGLLLFTAHLLGQTDPHRPGYLIVKVKPEYRSAFAADPTQIPELGPRLAQIPGFKLQRAFPEIDPPVLARYRNGVNPVDLSLIYYLSFDDQLAVSEAARWIGNYPAWEYVEPWYLQQVFYQPNDPAADTTGGQNNMWHLNQIKAREAWDVARGSRDVVVGITDSGTGDHPDLQANWALNQDDPVDGLDNDNDGYVDNYRGWDFGGDLVGGPGDNDPVVGNVHGTHVTGIVGATADNGIGFPGICFNCGYLPVKVSSNEAIGAIFFWLSGHRVRRPAGRSSD
ncbi:MAG: S8 family serine peptidase [Bacteroidota bacterium]